MMRVKGLRTLATVVLAVWLGGAATRADFVVSEAGKVTPAGLPAGLSGITYAGGSTFYAAEDSGGRFHALTIELNPANGAITNVVVAATRVVGGADLEGIAYNRIRNSVYLSDETGPAIREHAVGGGSALTNQVIPAVYASYRANFSLEALSMAPDGRVLWTANEEALYRAGTGVDDGPLASPSSGSVVRLQRWTRPHPLAAWAPAGQWAYRSEAWRGDSPFITEERSGVVALCALPNGKLVVLERDLSSFIPSLLNRLYEVDFSGATDVSALTALNGAEYTRVTKRQLWSRNFGTTENFEGICLGPRLASGAYSLIMIADGDSPLVASLYALRLAVSGADVWHSLQVEAAYGTDAPANWTYGYATGTWLTNAVGSPLLIGTSTQMVCSGWTLAGVEALESEPLAVTLALTNDAVLTWQWETQYRLSTVVNGRGSIQPAAGWLPAGSSVLFQPFPAVGYAFSHWTGLGGRPLMTPTVPWTVNQPLNVTATFIKSPASGALITVR